MLNKDRLYPLFVFGTLGLLAMVLVITVSNAWHYNYGDYADDVRFVVTYNHYGVWEGVKFLFNHHNGRLVCHFLFLTLAPLVTTSHFTEIAFYLINAGLFISALSFFIHSFFKYRYQLTLSKFQTFITASLFYSLLFFFFFGKRFEFWFWMADIPIYEYSLILMFILNGLLLSNKISKVQVAIITFISLCLGFMAETHAVAQLIILTMLLFARGFKFDTLLKMPRAINIYSGCLIVLSLAINYFSKGNQHKILISKTSLAGTSAPIKACYILANDLLLSWDSVIWKGHEQYAFNSIFIQIACLALLGLILTILLNKWFGTSAVVIVKNRFAVLLAGLFILLATYFITAVLYANLLDFIVDRCKYIGCVCFFFGLFDLITISSLSFGRKTR